MRPAGSGTSLAGRALQEAASMRYEIRDGRFQRSMAAVTGIAAIVSGAEAYTQHRRGTFSHRLMWTPIWLTPPAVVASAAAVVNERAARKLLPAVSTIVILDGILGFAYHIRGIRRMPGGFRLGRYNVVMGPPVFAPLLLCTVGVAGVLTGRLRRSRSRRSRQARLTGAFNAAFRHAVPTRRESDERERKLQRRLAVATGVLASVAGGEAYFEHLRGSFNNRLMWTPIWLTPPMVAAAVGAAASERIARRVLPITSAVTIVDGVLGFGLHLRGLQRMPGDRANLDFKITMGPPAFAPLLFAAVGMFGLIASLLRAGEDR